MSKEPTDPRAAENSWYYLQNGETVGPVLGTELRLLFRSKVLTPDTLVWRQGMRDWLPARDLGVGTARPPSAPSVATPSRSSTPPRDVSPPAVAPRSRVTGSSPGKARSRKHGVQLVAVCSLAAVTLLLCGVGIGLLLRAPMTPSRDDSRAEVPKDDHPPSRGRDSHEERRAGGQQLQRDVAAGPPALSAPPPALEQSASGRSPSEPMHEAGAEATQKVASPAAPVTGLNASATASATNSSARTAKVLYQVIDLHRRPSFGLTGITLSQEIRYKILSRLELSPRDVDGSQKVSQVVEQTRLDQADEMSRGTYETALRDLIGQRYAFTLTERGEVIEFTGFKKATATAPVSRLGEEGFLVVTVIDEDGWKELTQLSFLQPDRSIAAGQPWKRPMTHNWSPLGSWQGTTTYTQRGPESTGLRYDYAHEMTFVPSEKTSGVLPFDVTGASFRPLKAGGWFVFDVEQRQVTSVHEEYHVEGTVGAGLGGGVAEVQMQEIQETTIQISSQNPWQPER